MDLVIQIADFDKKLRLLTLYAIETIEVFVRVTVAHHLGRVKADAHRHPALLDGRFTSAGNLTASYAQRIVQACLPHREQPIQSLNVSGKLGEAHSAFTLAEVFKKSCEGKGVALPESKDLDFENFIEQEFLTLVQVNFDIGVLARRLLRSHPKLKKPSDAIHLATAALSNVDELHTTDGENLIVLDGHVKRQDGVSLTICMPPEEPPPPPLFDGLPPA